MLKIIYGHSGSGKSRTIYEMIKASVASGKRSYLIVPEQETVASERKLLELLPPSAQLTCEVLNFSRLANLVFRHYGGLSYNYADKGSKTLIMWKNLRELMPFLTEYSSEGDKGCNTKLAEEMLSAVNEFKAYCVSPQKLDAVSEKIHGNTMLKNKLRDLSLIMSAYNNHLEACYSDAADDLSKLSEKLKEHDFFAGSDVYIDSFTSFTRQERQVTELILKGADNLTVALPLDSFGTNQIHYESPSATASDLISAARKFSKELEEIHLGGSLSPSPMLKTISDSLWDHSVPGLPAEEHDGSVRMIKAADPYEESDAVANIIRGLMMGGMRCKDIAVIARDASIYKGIIDIALEKARIPYFFSQSSDIMSKASIKFVISALKIKIYNWRREDVIAYLKTDLLGFDKRSIDLFECYATMWDLRGKAFTGDDFSMNPDGYKEYLSQNGKAALHKINELKNRFVPPLVKLFARLDSATSAAEMCRGIYLFIEENRLAERIYNDAEKEYSAGRRKEAAESLQLYNALIKKLEDLATILGDEEISVREFYDSLKVLLNNTTVGSIPTAEDQVTVGSASMLRTSGVKCSILIGLNESEFPQNVNDTGIFSDRDKEILSGHDILLSGNSSLRSSDELFYVYRAMSSPSERLILMYHTSTASGDKAFPSMAIERIKKLFPCVKEEVFSLMSHEDTMLSPASAFERLKTVSPSPYSQAAKDYFKTHEEYRVKSELSDVPSSNHTCVLREETAKSVFGETLGLTQTLIDDYAECPFQYMCSHLLSVNDTVRASFDYANFGTYIHYIFEQYMKKAMEDGMIGKAPDRRYIEKIVDECASEYLERVFTGGAADNERLRHRFLRMRRLSVLVATAITREFADSNFRPEFLELSIGRPGKELSLAPLIIPRDGGGQIALTGKIDRVDLLRRENDIYVRVVDYKSGSKTFSFNGLSKGSNIQLPLYLFALCDEGQVAFRDAIGCPSGGRLIPAGAMYLSSLIAPVSISEEVPISAIRERAEASINRSGFLLGDEEILLEMSRSFSKQYLCGIYKTKDGSLSGNAGIPKKEMAQMNETLKNTVKRIAYDICAGKMPASPAIVGIKSSCNNCSMKAICRSAFKFNT